MFAINRRREMQATHHLELRAHLSLYRCIQDLSLFEMRASCFQAHHSHHHDGRTQSVFCVLEKDVAPR